MQYYEIHIHIYKIFQVVATSRSVIVIVVCTGIFAWVGDEGIVAFVGMWNYVVLHST